jgi:hypothetical protein
MRQIFVNRNRRRTMRSLIASVVLGVTTLTGTLALPAQADASWLSEALHQRFDPAYPRCYGDGSYGATPYADYGYAAPEYIYSMPGYAVPYYTPGYVTPGYGFGFNLGYAGSNRGYYGSYQPYDQPYRGGYGRWDGGDRRGYRGGYGRHEHDHHGHHEHHEHHHHR